MITYDYDIDVTPGSVPLIVPMTQYSDAFTLVFTLYSSIGVLSLASGMTGEISGTKTDGHGYSADALVNVINKTITVTGDQQMTAVAGNQVFRLVIKQSGKELYTANFVLSVQRAALDVDTIKSATQLREMDIEAILNASSVASHLPTIRNGNWYIWDTDLNDYADTGISATGPQGPQGPSGTAGNDGISPTVSISTISSGHRVTITDKEHPSGQTFDVADGLGSGDMKASIYDPSDIVANAGGIPNYVNGVAVSPYTGTPNMDGSASAGSSPNYSRGDHRHPVDTSRAPTNHSSSETAYGVGNSSKYGHVKLSDSTTSSSGTGDGVAATPKAVKDVKDDIPSACISDPSMDGAASPGSSTGWARGDHVHPSDTSKANLSLVNTFVRPNILVNGYFVGGGSQQGGGQFPINQRGQTSYSGAVYTIDRWRLWDSSGTFTIHNGYIESTKAFFQDIESGVLAGMKSAAEQITVSFLTSDNVLGVATSPYDVVNDNWVAEFDTGGYFDLLPGGTFALQFGGANITKFIAIKLELGDTQTLAHQENGEWVLNEIPNYQQELAKCQRYFVNLNMLSAGYPTAGGATAYNASTEYVVVNLPVPMRTQPTVSFVGNWYLQNGQTKNAVTAMSADTCTGSVFKIKCDSSGLTTGTYYILEGDGVGNYIYISADL